MNFIIRVTYKTGDSFNTYTDIEELDYGWDEETAKLNAEYIIEHYNAYSAYNDSYRKKADIEEIKKKPWYFKPDTRWGEIDPMLKLKLNGEGKTFSYFCPWCGYFETLESVEVVIQKFVLHPDGYLFN